MSPLPLESVLLLYVPREVGRLEDPPHYLIRILGPSVYRTNPYVDRPPPELPNAMRPSLLMKDAVGFEDLPTDGRTMAVHPDLKLLLFNLPTRSMVAGFRSTTGASLDMKPVTLVLESILVPMLVTLLSQRSAAKPNFPPTLPLLKAYPARLLPARDVFVEQENGRALRNVLALDGPRPTLHPILLIPRTLPVTCPSLPYAPGVPP